MDYTLDDEQLDGFMFDNSSSMDLSKQYFTVLQLLRTAMQWVEKDLADWESALPSYNDDVRSLLKQFMGSDYGQPWQLDVWDRDREEVCSLMKSQTEELKARMQKKSEEVASLRDGVCHILLFPSPYSITNMDSSQRRADEEFLEQLFNATSLREAVKGMALNRAIYVFTAVTIIYTPLGFIAVCSFSSSCLISICSTNHALTGILGPAYSEHDTVGGQYPSIHIRIRSDFCHCADFHIRLLRMVGLVLHFNKKLEIFHEADIGDMARLRIGASEVATKKGAGDRRQDWFGTGEPRHRARPRCW